MRQWDLRMIINITQDQMKSLEKPRKDNSSGKRKPQSTGLGFEITR